MFPAERRPHIINTSRQSVTELYAQQENPTGLAWLSRTPIAVVSGRINRNLAGFCSLFSISITLLDSNLNFNLSSHFSVIGNSYSSLGSLSKIRNCHRITATLLFNYKIYKAI